MIKLRTADSEAVQEWAMKEWGSWEDSKLDPDHPCAILQNFGKTMTLTKDQAERLIMSGEYQSTAWHDDEIDGGKRTKNTISRWVNILKNKLNNK